MTSEIDMVLELLDVGYEIKYFLLEAFSILSTFCIFILIRTSHVLVAFLSQINFET